MSNSFIDTIRKANERNWCTTPYCTTCIAREYRQALREVGGDLGGGLANALSELNPSELTREHNWQNGLLTAIIDLPLSAQLEGILNSWLLKLDEAVDFADFVLFKIVRNMPHDNDIRKKWIEKCLSVARDAKTFSLIESLLLVIGKDSSKYPELIEMANEYGKSSNQMRRVLRNVCRIT